MGNCFLSKLSGLSFHVQPCTLSSDKRGSNFGLLIHIMPALVLHVLIHVVHPEYSHQHYPAIKDVPNLDLLRRFWIPITIHTTWQGAYYFFNRRYWAKIVTGLRMTNFIKFRKIYRETWLGKWMTQFPEPTQFLIFMGLQVPCTHYQFNIDRLFSDNHVSVSCLVFFQMVFDYLFVRIVWVVSIYGRNGYVENNEGLNKKL